MSFKARGGPRLLRFKMSVHGWRRTARRLGRLRRPALAYVAMQSARAQSSN